MGGWLSGFAKGAMNKGIAGSVFKDKKQFFNQCIEQLPAAQKVQGATHGRL